MVSLHTGQYTPCAFTCFLIYPLYLSFLLPYLLLRFSFSPGLAVFASGVHRFMLSSLGSSRTANSYDFINSCCMKIPVWKYKAKRGKGINPELWVTFLCKEGNREGKNSKANQKPRRVCALPRPHTEMSLTGTFSILP